MFLLPFWRHMHYYYLIFVTVLIFVIFYMLHQCVILINYVIVYSFFLVNLSAKCNVFFFSDYIAWEIDLMFRLVVVLHLDDVWYAECIVSIDLDQVELTLRCNFLFNNIMLVIVRLIFLLYTYMSLIIIKFFYWIFFHIIYIFIVTNNF